jgi:Right handed beta helix region
MSLIRLLTVVTWGLTLAATAVGQLTYTPAGVTGGHATPASTAPAVVYVSASGSDANPCARATPCRQISHALSVVAAGGQVVVLASSDFQPITVTQTVSIIAPDGVYAGITSSTSHPVTISAAAADIVTLRGLTLNGGGSNLSVLFVNTGNVDVQNCMINNGAMGIGIGGTSTASIKNTMITTAVPFSAGVYSQSTAPVVIDACRFYGMYQGVQAVVGAQMTVNDSTVVGNGTGSGFAADSGSSLEIENSVATNNVFGIYSSNGAVIRVSNSTITNNTNGLSTSGSGAQLLSRGNNTVEANAANGSFTGSFSSK